MRTAVAVLLLLIPTLAPAKGELLRAVKASNQQAAELIREREARFAKMRENEREELRELQAEVRREESRVATAKQRWAGARLNTAKLEQDLEVRGRNLGILYDAVRGAAVDLHDNAVRSYITAQYPDRMDALKPLAASATLPGPVELEALWRALQLELKESGAVTRFRTPVSTPEGEQERTVTRVGVFALFSGEEFYRLSSDGRRLFMFEREPSRKYRALAREFGTSPKSIAPVVIDPALGALLLADANQPGLFDRLWNSGIGGYFIGGILILALVLIVLQSTWLRSRLILDEQSIVVTVVTLLVFAVIQFLFWTPGDPNASGDQVAIVDLINADDLKEPDEPPPPEIEPPPPPPDVPMDSSATALAGLPALAAPTAAPLMSNINIPVKISGGGSLKGLGFGGFARGTGQGAGAAGFGRGAGFKGKELIPLSTARPQMPEWACKQRIKGWVEAVFTVLPTGRVQDVKIVDAEPRGVYELAAIESINNWIYAETKVAREVKQRVPMDPADCAFNWR